jgi:flagellar hook-basal body complex protein FliE
MMIPPVQGFDFAAIQPAPAGQAAGLSTGSIGASSAADGQSPFLDTLKSAIGTADQLGNSASQQVAGVLTGTGGDVHSAMIAVEKADLSFQMMMQVRNKMVQAYQEISRMPF